MMAIYARPLTWDWFGDETEEDEPVATFDTLTSARSYLEKSKLKKYSKPRMSHYRANSLLSGYVKPRIDEYTPKHPPHEPRI